MLEKLAAPACNCTARETLTHVGTPVVMARGTESMTWCKQ
jgi:hypothetical protein